eukprot:scaffold940_cov569-Prasinococcus_capsulatus_cf.AAC.25
MAHKPTSHRKKPALTVTMRWLVPIHVERRASQIQRKHGVQHPHKFAPDVVASLDFLLLLLLPLFLLLSTGVAGGCPARGILGP